MYAIRSYYGNVADIVDPAALARVEYEDRLMEEKADMFRTKYPETIQPAPQPDWEKDLLRRQREGLPLKVKGKEKGNCVSCNPVKHVADSRDGVWALDVIV